MVCRVCGSNSYEKLIDFGPQPIVHNLLENNSNDIKKYPFQLDYCNECGFVFIKDPIPAEILYQNYFTVSSWKYQPHVARLIELINCFNDYEVDNTNLLDIGCNDGSFLSQLKKFGYKKLYGVEPTKDAYELCTQKHKNIINDFFSLKKASSFYSKEYFDIITSRQVLEHIIELNDFLEGIHYILKDNGILILELPNFGWNLSNLDYGLWEEHVNYFTFSSLNTLLRKNNFSIFHHEITLFSGTAITVFAQKSTNKNKKQNLGNHNKEIIQYYGKTFPILKNRFQEFISKFNNDVKVYGCGCRSSTMINFLELSNFITSYIDDQPEKQNKFVPGSMAKIKPWIFEEDHSSIILMGVNAESESKLIKKRNLSRDSTFSICPPSPRLPDFWKKEIEDQKYNF